MAEQILNSNGFLIGLPLAQYVSGGGIRVDNTTLSISSAPQTLSDTQIEALKRALSIDETVLFEGDMANNDTITLPESIYDFEKVRVEGYGSSAGAASLTMSTDMLGKSLGAFCLYSVSPWTNSSDGSMNTYSLLDGVRLQFASGTVLKSATSFYFGMTQGATTWTAATRDNSDMDIHVKRVVGIGRKK